MKPEHKEARKAAMPLLVAASGARDRAAHYETPVGAVVCECKLNINLVGLVPAEGMNKDMGAQLEKITSHFVLLFETCAKTFADEASRVLDHPVPGALNFMPNVSVCVCTTGDPLLNELHHDLITDGPTEVLDGLAISTADIVGQWSAKAAS